MSKIGKVFVFIVFLLVIVLIYAIQQKSKNQTKKNRFSYPRVENIYNEQFVSGMIVPSKEIQIKSQISGILKEVYPSVGDKVNMGDPIASVEIIANPENLERANQNVRVTRINYQNEREIFDRNKQLFDKGVISLVDFQQIERQYVLAKENYESAKELLYIAKKGFSRNQKVTNIIRSTSQGIVLELPTQVGAAITERNNFNDGTTLAVIADMDKIIFKGKINERDVPTVRDSAVFEIAINAMKEIPVSGRLLYISPKGYLENGITKFDIETTVELLDSLSIAIRSGYSAIATLITEKRDSVLTIDEKDIIYEKDSTYVEIIDAADKPIKKAVEIGVSNGIRVEVINGLSKQSKVKSQ
ncbi:MAG: efflux RND transporter periplasmic adaptor subunit [Flavobacteriales bacterium]|nr:efflux RND transporter periplasmic adaptor subunit [Flavobacteriales bacterium]